ncbi:hypothetical protein [Aquimarina aggregata]|uniref:hypothetical protein n=1 Tax=Aquimarina aggregata TaxID=1642818 RepID=UPI000A7B0849|nr:hypothetical protein [Aquimarina aggregata]
MKKIYRSLNSILSFKEGDLNKWGILVLITMVLFTNEISAQTADQKSKIKNCPTK